MKGSRMGVIDAYVRANLIPESASELCAAVDDENIRYAMLADHVLNHYSWQLQCVDVMPAWEVDRHLIQSVDDYRNPSVCRWCCLWQVSAEIHCDFFPRLMRWWQWHIGSVACMVWSLDSVAYLASSNVLWYLRIHHRHVEISRSEFSSSRGSKVARFRIVMEKTHHLAAERFWYIYPPFVGQGL